MNYADIKRWDVANGPGIRVSLFVSGCPHACKGCFNQEAWDFSYGKPFTEETENFILKELGKTYYHGMTLLGGEPLHPDNQKGLLSFIKKVREHYPEKTIWCYSGYMWKPEILGWMYENVPETKELLACIDVLVDGRFVEEKKQPDLLFRGSANQRLINVPQSLQQGKTVLWEPEEYIHVEVKENPKSGVSAE